MTFLSWTYATLTAIYATLAVFVVRHNPKAAANRFCGLFLISIIFWTQYGIFHHLREPLPLAQAALAHKIGWTAGGPSWAMSAYLLIFLALANRKRYLRSWKTYIVLLGVPLAIAVRGWFGPVTGTLVQDSHGYWGTHWTFSFWAVLFVVDVLTKSFLGLYLVARFGRHASDARQRRQALVLFCAGAVGTSSGALSDIAWPAFTGNPTPELSQIAGLIWVSGIFISVTRYGLTPFTVQAAADKILATVPDMLLLVNTSGNIMTANEATSDLLGFGQKELVGTPAARLLSRPEDFSPLLGRLEAEHHLAGLESTLSARDGRKVPVSITARTLPQADGTVRGSVWVLHDITAIRQAEEMQAQMTREIAATNDDLAAANKVVATANKELAAANQDLASFAYVVSHDLKAPLRAIDSLVRWLASDYGDKFEPEGKEQVQLLLGRVKRMHNLIEGVLQYSRAGRVREKQVEVNLSQMLLEVIDILSPPAHFKVQVETPLPTVSAERTRIEQVFQNLLSNAVKYNDKPEGVIRVGGIDGGDHWRFYVADNGPGIEEKDFERIFQVFQTGKPRDQVESTGVGLAVVKRSVELYGGRVWVESRLGEGSTFFFTHPKQMPAPER